MVRKDDLTTTRLREIVDVINRELLKSFLQVGTVIVLFRLDNECELSRVLFHLVVYRSWTLQEPAVHSQLSSKLVPGEVPDPEEISSNKRNVHSWPVCEVDGIEI